MRKKLTALALCLCLFNALLPVTAMAEEIGVDVDKNAVLSGLFEGDIATIREALDAGLVTSRELTQYYLDRIEAYNKPYNCFITICADALSQADARDREIAEGKKLGSLHGIPIVVKDNIDVAGVHTTNGHKKQDSQIAKDNAEAVQKLIDAGAVILAKANMSKDARSAYWSKSDAAGEVKNAYNPIYSPGGSSAGSAVSVSLNFAAASLGTDTNSSLRIPAALAGCFALRPTFDLVSRDGVIKLNGARDTVGAITRTASDLVLMMDVLTGGTYDYAANRNKDVFKGLRLGIVKELTYPTTLDSYRTEKNIDDEVEAVFARAVKELKALGAEVVEISFPNIYSLAGKATNQTGMENMYEAYLKVLEKNNVSALIYPTYLSTPLKTGRDENGVFWNIFDDKQQVFINNCRSLSSCAKLPEITIPIGHHSGGPGIGLEIAAPRYAEQFLLDIALSYSESYNYRVAPTGAPDDYAVSSMGSLRNVLDDYYARLAEANKPPVTQQPTEPPAQPQTPEEAPDIPAAVVLLTVSSVSLTTILTSRRRRRQEEEKEETAVES